MNLSLLTIIPMTTPYLIYNGSLKNMALMSDTLKIKSTKNIPLIGG